MSAAVGLALVTRRGSLAGLAPEARARLLLAASVTPPFVAIVGFVASTLDALRPGCAFRCTEWFAAAFPSAPWLRLLGIFAAHAIWVLARTGRAVARLLRERHRLEDVAVQGGGAYRLLPDAFELERPVENWSGGWFLRLYALAFRNASTPARGPSQSPPPADQGPAGPSKKGSRSDSASGCPRSAGCRRMRTQSNTWGVSFLPRFIGRGLGLALSFSRIDVSTVQGLGVRSSDLGSLHVHPFMAGLDWQQPLGTRTTAQLHAVAGCAFNSTSKPNEEPFDAQIVVSKAVDHVDNSFAWQTRLVLWHDLAPRFGLMMGARYLDTRPKLTLSDGSQRTWKADRVTLEAGLAFTLIKPPWARHPRP